jgi:predicted nucleic acid-binding protein
MIVLDTNVVSALMQAAPDGTVVAWLDHYPLDAVCLTSINVFEIRSGLEILAEGRRRRQLEAAFARLQDEKLQGRVLPFDRNSAEAAAAFWARLRSVGRPVEFRDAQIAGIVAANDATLATSNVRDFQDLAIELANPWTDG